MAFTQDFFTSRRNFADGATRVGDKDRLWYDSGTNSIRISDGVTPGGILVGGGGGGGGINPGDNVSLLTNDAGYIDLTSLSGIGDISYNNTTGEISFANTSNFITLTDISGTGDISYNNATGEITFNNSTGFITLTNLSGTGDISYNNATGEISFANTSGYTTTSDSISVFSDIDADLPGTVVEDSILIYNATDNEFVAESFTSVLERLKAELEVQYDRLVDEDQSSSLYTYIGEAEPGSLRTQAVWRIKRIFEQPDGDLEILWADGSAAFNKIWNDRATFDYSA